MISILLVHGPDIIPKCQALAANNNNRKQRTPLMRRIRSILPPKFPLALPWYEEGLEFECTGCSKCCQVDGDVWLAPEEVTSIANYLQKTDEDDIIASIDAFRKKYVRAELSPADDDGDDGDEDPSLQSQSSSWMCLKRTKEGACTFLDPSGKCSIYDVRPVQCSTYPFWPSLLEDPEAWEEESVLPDDVPLENGNNADNTRRHWSPEHGGCEGIGTSIGRIMDTVAQLDEKDLKDVDLNRLVQEQQQEAIMVEREEIQAKRKKAKRHWRRFPGEDIKMSTWYL
jgi:Fe-S-cluster containining protein